MLSDTGGTNDDATNSSLHSAGSPVHTSPSSPFSPWRFVSAALSPRSKARYQAQAKKTPLQSVWRTGHIDLRVHYSATMHAITLREGREGGTCYLLFANVWHVFPAYLFVCGTVEPVFRRIHSSQCVDQVTANIARLRKSFGMLVNFCVMDRAYSSATCDFFELSVHQRKFSTCIVKPATTECVFSLFVFHTNRYILVVPFCRCLRDRVPRPPRLILCIMWAWARRRC